MYKKNIKYTDKQGRERTDTFYFNFTIAEIIKFENEEQVTLSEIINDISSSKDPKVITDNLRYIILKSYCEKSEDNVSFIKSEKLSADFSRTEAFYNLHLELATDALAAANFINSIIPKI